MATTPHSTRLRSTSPPQNNRFSRRPQFRLLAKRFAPRVRASGSAICAISADSSPRPSAGGRRVQLPLVRTNRPLAKRFENRARTLATFVTLASIQLAPQVPRQERSGTQRCMMINSANPGDGLPRLGTSRNEPNTIVPLRWKVTTQTTAGTRDRADDVIA